MHTFEFEAFGTAWAIVSDGPQISSKLQKEILTQTNSFDQKFSRFKTNSEAVSFRYKPAGTYTITQEFALILKIHDELRHITKGKFDPAVGKLLELAGYDQKYTFIPKHVKNFKLPTWNITGNLLTISGPVVFDIGGIGKGYWIDHVANFLKKNNFHHFLVDGGGDMFATSKANGESWKVAIEWPGKPNHILGTVLLKNQGFAASDTLKRTWGNWHHLLNITKNEPQQTIIANAAIANSALNADQMTSVLSLCETAEYKQAAEKLRAQYLAITTNNQVLISENWSGKLF